MINNNFDIQRGKLTYINVETPITKFFKLYLRENKFFRKFPSYFFQYRLMSFLHNMIPPFNYLKRGDTGIQVGCAEWMLDFGVSMPLIMSAIVGNEGQVVVVEPDQRNIDKLEEYLKRHKIENITIVKKAAWREKTIGKFNFYADRTSSNVIAATEDESSWKDTAGYLGRQKDVREVEMDTIDNICANLHLKPDLVNLTINCTEFEVIKGMNELMKQGVKIAWLFGNRDWWQEAIAYVQNKNYDVVTAISPYSYRAPNVNGKVKFYKYNKIPQIWYAIAIPAANRMPDPREFPVKLLKQKHNDFMIIPTGKKL